MDTPQPIGPPGGGDEHQMPRWVKGFIIAAVAVVLLVVVVLAISSGEHSPSRHLPGGDEETTQTSEGHAPPGDH